VVIGGWFNTLLRYLLSAVIQKQSERMFPYGILIVNPIGTEAIGFLW